MDHVCTSYPSGGSISLEKVINNSRDAMFQVNSWRPFSIGDVGNSMVKYRRGDG